MTITSLCFFQSPEGPKTYESLSFEVSSRRIAPNSERLIHAAALALILASSVPASAGDARPIKSCVAPVYPDGFSFF